MKKQTTDIWKFVMNVAALLVTVGGILAVISYNNARIDRIDPQVQKHEAMIAQMRSDLDTNIKYIREGKSIFFGEFGCSGYAILIGGVDAQED